MPASLLKGKSPAQGRAEIPVRTRAPITPPDQDSFEAVYREHCQGVFGMAARLCGRDHAADIAQEVFLQYWRNPGRFDPNRGSLRSLLLTMTHNKSVDLVRSRASRSVRETKNGTFDVALDTVDVDLLRDERRSSVFAALDCLPGPQRDAIVVAFYGQCTYKDAAIVLNVPEGTAKARIRSGLVQLRETLTEAQVNDMSGR